MNDVFCESISKQYFCDLPCLLVRFTQAVFDCLSISPWMSLQRSHPWSAELTSSATVSWWGIPWGSNTWPLHATVMGPQKKQSMIWTLDLIARIMKIGDCLMFWDFEVPPAWHRKAWWTSGLSVSMSNAGFGGYFKGREWNAVAMNGFGNVVLKFGEGDGFGGRCLNVGRLA